MVCGLVACGSTAYKNEDLDFVKVINASNEEIYGIGYTYYVDEKVVRSGGGCNADNSAIKVGDELQLENKPYFEEEMNVEIELSVVSKSGKEYPCVSKCLLNVENGTAWIIEITGDFEKGFDAVISEEGKTYSVE